MTYLLPKATRRIQPGAPWSLWIALCLLAAPEIVHGGAESVFGPLTGVGGRAVLDAYANLHATQALNFDNVTQDILLDTEFSAQAGVTFWTTTTIAGHPLVAPHNISLTSQEYSTGPHAVGATPFPRVGYDGRASYEIRFNQPQRWAGLERVWSSVSPHCLTRFYAANGDLLAELNAHPERFVGYICQTEDPATWISVIECTGGRVDGIPQVGPSDNLVFGQGLDTQSPDIILQGQNPLVLHVGEDYEEPGFTAVDDYQGDMTPEVEVSGTVDSTVVGTYLLRYRVADQWGNQAIEAIRTIRVVDARAPDIVLQGQNPLVLHVGDKYEEPGFTAVDDYQGDMTPEVEVSGTVDSNVVGFYLLHYRVADQWGNEAVEAIRTVQVVDTRAPDIILQGQNPLLLRVGESYVEPGFTATDDYQGDVTSEVQVSGSVDSTVVGTYLLRYRVADQWGNEAAEVTRTVQVLDTEGPSIILQGQNPLLLRLDERYEEPGFTALDDHQGDVTANVEVSGTVDSTVVGTYLLHYRVADQWGNEAAEVVRTVQVVDARGPEIILHGQNPLILHVGDGYEEPGFTAMDDYQGDVTSEVKVSGTVDTTVSGSYLLHYRVADQWGNESAEAIRIVQVIGENPPPLEPGVSPSGTIDTTKRPKFSWEPVPKAKKYRLIVWKANGKAYYKTWQTGTTWQPTFDFKAGEYTWAVQPYDSDGLGARSDSVAFEIVLVVPPAATLLTPEGTVANSKPVFAWTEEEYATWSQVLVQRSGKTVLQLFVKNATSYTPEHDDRLRYGRYTWWVRGWGLDGPGDWSDPMQFTYGVLTPLAPDGRENSLDRQPTFEWTSFAGALWYQVYLARNGGAFLSRWIELDTAWSLTEELPPGDYTWWVRAWNERGTGPWSEMAGFRVGAVIGAFPAGPQSMAPSLLSWDNGPCPEATWFSVQIDRSGETYTQFWVSLEDTSPAGGDYLAVSLPPDLGPLPSGSYTWRVRTWQPSGLGPWSDGVDFSVP